MLKISFNSVADTYSSQTMSLIKVSFKDRGMHGLVESGLKNFSNQTKNKTLW